LNYAGKFGSGGLDSLSSTHLDLDSLSHRGHADAITVPDAHLLFSGDFHKSGPDLIISDQFHRVVVPDYFRGEKHPTLVSPNGAPLDPKVVDALTGHTEYAQAGGAPAVKVVGHVVKMTGSASVVRNGVTVDVQSGDAVYQSDVVQTGSGSTLGLVLNDGTTFNLSAGARLMLNDLTYDASSTSNSALFTLVQGAANFVAGQVAKTGDMKVATPVATMGIRGTAVVLDVDATDGTVSISVVDQHDGLVHAVQVFNARGVLIGTVTSNGSSLTLTPTASFDVIAQESNKTVAQIAMEFNALQNLLLTYDFGKQLFPDLPQHTDNNANPQSTKHANNSVNPIYTAPTFSGDGGANKNSGNGGQDPDPSNPNNNQPSIDGTGDPKKVDVVVIDATGTHHQDVPDTSIAFVVDPPVTPITSGEGNHTNPVMSASGDVVYDPDGIVYFYDRASGVTTRVTPENDGFTYSGQTISSDGRYVAYQGTDGTHTYVYVWGTDPSDTAHYHKQTEIAAGGSPAISGDGSTILVQQAGGSIGIYDLQGHSKGTITPASVGSSGALSNPAISADGHMIAFWSSDTANPNGPEHLYTYNVSTGAVTEIASSSDGGAPAASISADGRYVVYQSHAADGHIEISLYDVTAGQVVYTTASAHEIVAGDSKNPVISPDGHFIIFTSTAELTPGDTNNYADTYVVDVTDPAAPVYTLISEHGDAPSDSGVAISAGGLFVAFGSAASFYTSSTGGNIFVADPTSGRTAIIQETASSPDHLTASGVIGITGGSAGVTLTVTDSDGHPTGLLSAALSADGQTISWNFSEAKSDFVSLHYGQDLTQHFLITLNYAGGVTSIPVIVGVHDAVQPVIVPVDVAPVASVVTLAEGQENHSYVIMPDVLLAHVGDIDGPSLSITEVSVKTGGGSLEHNEDGSWTYTPAEGFHGQVVFNYTASDGTLTSSSTASLDLVVPIDQPPVAAPVTLPAGTEDASYTVCASSLLTGVTDPDGPSLSITSVSIASGGGNLVDNHDGTWTYTPVPGYAGPVNFNYTASDGTLSASSTANLTLAPETAIAPTLTVGANVTFVPTDGAAVETSLHLHAGDVLTFQWNFTTDDYLPFKDFAFASVNGAAFLLSDIQSTGSYGSTGWHTFSYTATADGTYNIGTGVMNDQDLAVMSYLAIDNFEVNGTVVQSFENGLAGSTVLGDVSVVASAHSQVNSNPILPTNGSMEAFLTSDPILESQIESFLGLAPGRLAGVGQSEGPEHTAIIVPITVSVAGNTHPDETYVTISGAPAGSVFNHGVYNSEDATWHIDAADLGGNLTITTPLGYFGSFTLSVTATSVVEGSHTSATTTAQTQVVTVDPVDPVATALTLADGTEDTPYTIHASDLLAGASDPSGAALSISAVDIASGGGSIVDNHDGTWTYTPAHDYNGAVSFSYTASDGTLTASSTASLTLAAVDDAPVATPVTLTPGTEDTTYTISTAALLTGVIDVDGPSLSISSVSIASGGGSLHNNDDGTWSYTPAANYNGPVSFNYTASDGTLTASSTASLALAAVNDSPVIAAGTDASASINVPVTPTVHNNVSAPLALELADSGLISGLPGETGFGSLALGPSDDGSSGLIDITSVFGANGVNFFGNSYTSLYVNNNGNISFGHSISAYTPSAIGAGLSFPIIAPFWADVDTRLDGGAVSYDLDASDGVMTITWDHVGYFGEHKDKLDTFQLVLINEGNGNFDIEYRYGGIQWTTGDASSGSNGLGGTPARAGYSAGDGVHYFELPQSGNQSALLNLPNADGNTGIAGVDHLEVRNGVVGPSSLTATGAIDFSDPDLGDTHSIQSVTYTGAGTELGTLSLVKVADTTGTGTGGQFTWNYSADPAAVQSALAGIDTHSKVETFDVVISDDHGVTVHQTVSVTLAEPAPMVTISVLTPDSVDFHASGPLAEMGAGTIQSGHGSTTFTIVDSADNVSFVVDGSNFTYGSSGDVTSIAGGTLTSFHEFTADGSTALADFTGLAVDAVTWMNDVKLAHAGNTGPIDALTSTFAYTFNGGSGNDSFGSEGHADTLTGGAGDDTLDPGGAPAGGHDTVTGGAGSDTILYQAGYGALTITDFDQGNETGVFDPNEADHVQLNGLTAPQSVSYANGNAILDFGNNDIVTLLHVSQSQYEGLGGSEFTNGGDGAPVIAIDDVHVSPNENGTTTVSGLSVTDADASPSEIFTLVATSADGATVTPALDSGHLADINNTLQRGLTYDQAEDSPSTDTVAVTVTDAQGASDTVNLIFNVADNPATPVTLTGTTDKDVFFGTGNADQFVFAAHSGHDTIMNFTHGQDHIDLSAVVTGVATDADAANWFSQHVAAVPGSNDVLITIDAADTIRLHNPVGPLTANDFILHPGGGNAA
jgi:hypothetical protein